MWFFVHHYFLLGGLGFLFLVVCVSVCVCARTRMRETGIYDIKFFYQRPLFDNWSVFLRAVTDTLIFVVFIILIVLTNHYTLNRTLFLSLTSTSWYLSNSSSTMLFGSLSLESVCVLVYLLLNALVKWLVYWNHYGGVSIHDRGVLNLILIWVILIHIKSFPTSLEPVLDYVGCIHIHHEWMYIGWQSYVHLLICVCVWCRTVF